jgi:hypothetical protein
MNKELYQQLLALYERLKTVTPIVNLLYRIEKGASTEYEHELFKQITKRDIEDEFDFSKNKLVPRITRSGDPERFFLYEKYIGIKK